MSPLVPRRVAEDVLQRINADADAADWDRLSQAEKTAKIAAWVEAEDIGGVLKPLLGGEAEARMWLKDVALRRRSWHRQPEPEFVAERVFGDAATSIIAVGRKPSHAVVERAGEKRYLCWGPYTNVRNLVWAALNAEFEHGVGGAHVAIVERGTITPPDRRSRLQEIAKRTGVDITWMTV